MSSKCYICEDFNRTVNVNSQSHFFYYLAQRGRKIFLYLHNQAPQKSLSPAAAGSNLSDTGEVSG